MLGGGGVITFLVFVLFDLGWTRLLYFGGCTSSYVGRIFCTSVDALHLTLDTSPVLPVGALHSTLNTSSVLPVDALHLTLDTSSVLWRTHFVLCWTRLLYFGECTSSYVGQVSCTSGGCTSSYVGHVFCTSVDALHLTLGTSSVLRWMHFILRWTSLL